MKLCPMSDQNGRAAEQVKDLKRSVRDRVRKWNSGEEAVDLGALEAAIKEGLAVIGREAMGEALEGLDPDQETIQYHGRSMQRVLTADNSYLTCFGEVRVRRGLYRAAGRNTETVCPMEGRAGIISGYWTPGAARLGALLMADVTSRKAQQICAEVGLLVSTSTLGRLLPGLSAKWEADRESNEALLRESAVADEGAVPPAARAVCVSVDGVMAPMRDKTAARQVKREAAGKHASGPSGYREIGCGTLTFYDEEGERLHTIYQARMPEARKATLRQMLLQELQQVVEQRPELARVYVCDGAAVNWDITAKLEADLAAQAKARGLTVTKSVEIVDYFHACQHLKTACDAIFGESTPRSKVEFECLKTKLKDSEKGVQSIINVLRYRLKIAHSATKTIQEGLTYFRNQQSRMRYARYQQLGLPIGSGVVEAACKTLVTQRMKRSGMAWSQAGGQAILTFRSWLQSERFDSAWEILTAAYQNHEPITQNYSPPRLKLAA